MTGAGEAGSRRAIPPQRDDPRRRAAACTSRNGTAGDEAGDPRQRVRNLKQSLVGEQVAARDGQAGRPWF